MQNPDTIVFDDLETEVQCEEVYGDPLPDFDSEAYWFDADGGITGDAQEYLGEIDRDGGFI